MKRWELGLFCEHRLLWGKSVGGVGLTAKDSAVGNYFKAYSMAQ